MGPATLKLDSIFAAGPEQHGATTVGCQLMLDRVASEYTAGNPQASHDCLGVDTLAKVPPGSHTANDGIHCSGGVASPIRAATPSTRAQTPSTTAETPSTRVSTA